jgi:hypothetical protein
MKQAVDITPPRALGSLRLGARRILIVPHKSLKYLAASLAILVGALLLVEKIMIPHLSSRGQLMSLEWQQENAKIIRLNFNKNLATPSSPVWRSKGFPVTSRRRKPKRVLVVGDSFVWGSGNANLNDLWWRQLERALEDRGYHDVEVVGAGYSGWSTHEELDGAKGVIAEYTPDALVWGYVTNDPDERVVKQMHLGARVFGFLSRRVGMVFPNVSAMLQERQTRKTEMTKGGDDLGYSYEQWELRLLEGHNFALYQKTVHDFGEYLATLPMPKFMMTLPNYPSSAHFKPRHEPVLLLLRSANVPTFDILPDFVARYGEVAEHGSDALAWGMNPADAHPGPRSTRFFAERAADILASTCPSCLGPKSDDRAAPAHVNDWMPPDLDVSRDGGELSFVYPSSNADLLLMPAKRPYVQLNLERAAMLREVRVRGAGLKEATVDVTTLDPVERFDDRVVRTLGTRPGGSSSFEGGEALARPVSTVRITAAFEGADRRMAVTLVPASSARVPP